MSNQIGDFFRQAITTLWPRECFVCGETARGAAVCPACEPMLARLPETVCPRCALPTPVDGMLCGQCLHRLPYFDATRAAFIYAQPVREMVLALKHGHGFGLLEWLSAELSAILVGLEADCIVPVPLHDRRLAERGFNQSNELARRVARVSGVPLRPQAIIRDVNTPKFVGLRGKLRRSAVRGVFRAVEDFTGQHVIVLDDVMTSGATLNELARTLKQRGAVRVTNLVVARTLRRRQK